MIFTHNRLFLCGTVHHATTGKDTTLDLLQENEAAFKYILPVVIGFVLKLFAILIKGLTIAH